MNKSELIHELATRNSVDNSVADKIINGFVDLVIEKLKAGEEVAITGFGTFLSKARAARQGVNPRNPSVKIQIAATKVPKFKAGKTLKDELKK
jgi:DNA-binding protein HU-beta